MAIRQILTTILLTSFALLIACGGGGGGSDSSGADTTTNQAPSGNTPPTQNSSLTIINGYMAIVHNQEVTNYESNLRTLLANLSAQGKLRSSEQIIGTINLVKSHTTNFLNTSIAYINSTRATYSLDKNGTIALMQNYMSIDVSRMQAAISSAYKITGLAVNSGVVSSAVTDINNAYSIAIATIQVM